MGTIDGLDAVRGKCIVLGVCASIAAYKAVDIASQLVKWGADVRVVMTPDAVKLIPVLTLQTLSRNPVAVDMWNEPSNWEPGHISLADRADLLLVAPLSANTLAKFACGLAPDLLSCVYLATQAPVMLAPAMNGKMLAHPATQQNLRTMRDRGHQIIEPHSGMLACGYEGRGKLAPVEEICETVRQFFASL